MDAVQDGYSFFEKNTGSFTAASMGDAYVLRVNDEIQNLVKHLNDFEGFKTSTGALKGNIAEFWHSDTFNINATIRNTKNRTYVPQDNGFASVDITSNFGKEFGLKYYKSGVDSAKQQAKSIFERFKEYQAQGGSDSLDEFLKKRGLDDIDTLLSDPIYSGQVRIIPKDQLLEAQEYLKRKIAEEAEKRPEQVKRYQETLKMLSDKISDNDGTESVALSKEDAEKLAALAKEGKISKEELKKLGISTEEMISYEYVLQQAFKAGLSAATISLVLKIAPEIYKSILQLIKNGELDENQFKKIGFAAISGSGEGFIRGSVSAAITTACKTGLWGEALKSVEPSVVGAMTVIVIDTMKNSFKVASGNMRRSELATDLIKEMYISTCSLICGGLTQSIVEVPVFGFMLGSFVGSMVGSFTYNFGYQKAITFCIDSGFTMFGLVEQNYELPVDILEEIGLDVFRYENFEVNTFEFDRFETEKFEVETFHPEVFSTEDGIDFTFLRRGVIGINKIGYVI